MVYQEKILRLGYENSKDDQLQAIQDIVNDTGFPVQLLIQDRIDKDYWENAAIVLSKLGSPRIDCIIPSLLEWVEDLNWPGALIITGLLYSLPKKELEGPVTDALEQATIQHRKRWYKNLTWLFVERDIHESNVLKDIEQQKEILKDYFGEIYP